MFLPETLFEIKVLEYWIQLATSLGTLGILTCCVLRFPLQITLWLLASMLLQPTEKKQSAGLGQNLSLSPGDQGHTQFAFKVSVAVQVV